MSLRPRRLVPAVLAALMLAGCAAGDAADTAGTAPATAPGPQGDVSDPGSTAPARDGIEDGATDPQPFPAVAGADTAEPSSGARVTVSDIRIGRHDGFDRVVLEVGGEGLPGWDVRYVDQASSQGSGAPVEVAGEAVLQVTVTGAGYPFETGVEEFSAAGAVSAAETQTVTELVFDATYEGTTVVFVGTSAPAPFRVDLLEAPTRVVIDVAHAR